MLYLPATYNGFAQSSLLLWGPLLVFLALPAFRGDPLPHMATTQTLKVRHRKPDFQSACAGHVTGCMQCKYCITCSCSGDIHCTFRVSLTISLPIRYKLKKWVYYHFKKKKKKSFRTRVWLLFAICVLSGKLTRQRKQNGENSKFLASLISCIYQYFS